MEGQKCETPQKPRCCVPTLNTQEWAASPPKVYYLSCCQQSFHSDIIMSTAQLFWRHHIFHCATYYTEAWTWDWKQPESMFKVEFYIIRLIANCLQVHWEHPIFKTFSKGFHPPTPLSSSDLVHPPLQSLYLPLFIGHQLCTLLYFFCFCCTFIRGIHNFIIKKD